MDGTMRPTRNRVGELRRRMIRGVVQEFGRRLGYPPSYREIADEVGLSVFTVPTA